MLEVKIGCCGFPISKKKYYSIFEVVEVQQTFYKLVKFKTLEKWRKEAPEEFEFTIKAFQGITHDVTSPTWKRSNIKNYEQLRGKVGLFRPTEYTFKFWEYVKEEAKMLESKVIIMQAPASYKDSPENTKNFKEFFNSIDYKNFKIGVELRGWRAENIRKVCEEFDLIDVTDPFKRLPTYVSDVLYFRLHGKYRGNKIIYTHKYDEAELVELKNIVMKYKEKENLKKIYVMFNNIYSLEDAQRFSNVIKQCC